MSDEIVTLKPKGKRQTFRSKDFIRGFPSSRDRSFRTSALRVQPLRVTQLATALALGNRSPFLLDFIQRPLRMSA